MEEKRVFKIRTHSQSKLNVVDHADKLELTLTNLITGDNVTRFYYKVEEGFTVMEILKIDGIVYHMTNEIGLNMWDDNGGFKCVKIAMKLANIITKGE